MINERVLYTGKTHVTGGRDGLARSDDERLNVRLSAPGSSGAGTNPEQLLAAGWSACFIGAMKIAAANAKIVLPVDTTIDAEVDLCIAENAYFLQAQLTITVPGIDRDVARELAQSAHQTCPYSKATRGNIDVVINVV
ncbi:Ohr subfamily peroxiredoxin [Luteibacter sp. Sphag1AF]|uniref:organic hydroperoxide resistance protein n=1 Tax=Luteibacter sp. Sphag1AF TaxID=2587031 RepID=UPI0017CDC529|nr:Ohr subfamily peroxiredoxin [Luteibacter sp. Sphag1AF]